jgi:hypothetical protein
LTAIK